MTISAKVIEFDELVKALNKIIFGSEIETVTLNGIVKPTISNFLKSYTISKADVSYVNTKIASVNTTIAAVTGGHKAYATLAGAQASQASLPANTVVEVTNDSNANNGAYLWDGATLTKSNYDPLNRAMLHTDQSISDLVTVGVNLFNKNKTTPNSYYAYTTGKLDPSPDFVSYFCEVKPSTQYRVPSFYGQQIAFYGDNREYVSGLALVAADGLFTTPANVFYVGLSVVVNIVDTMMLCEASLYPNGYVPYLVNLNDSFVTLDQVEGLKESLNILNAPYAKGKYVSYSTGVTGPAAGYYLVGKVKVKPNTRYKTSSTYAQQFAFYDENGTYISGMLRPLVDFTFVTPPNARYAYFTVDEYLFGSAVIAEYVFFDKAVLDHQYALQENIFVRASQVGGLTQNIQDTVTSRLGLRPLNILDTSKFIDNSYVDFTTGNLLPNPEYYAAIYCEVKPNTEYQTSVIFYQQYAFYDENYRYISGAVNPPPNKKFITPVNAKYAGFSILKSQANDYVIAESEIFPSGYVNGGVYLSEKLRTSTDIGEVKNTEIWVSADTSDTTVTFTGKNAIQLAINSVTDASPTNRYTVRAKKGLYKIDKASDFIGYIGYPSMIEMKDYVDVVGQGEGNTIVWAELPYNDADIGLSVNGQAYPRNQYQTIYNFAKEATAKDLTFVAKNLRYTLHQDDLRGANTVRHYRDVGMVFKGTKGSLNAFGTGTSSGEETYVIGGKAMADLGIPFAVHNNTKFDKPSVWSFENYNFTCINNRIAILLNACGSLIEDKLKLVGCSFGGKAYTIMYNDSWLSSKTSLKYDSFNHAEWRISGHGNDPFWFENIVTSGVVLRFTSDATGAGGEIRFDKNSSAFPLLIKNNQTNADASLYTDNREYIDGYIAEDGSIGLPSRAFGCLDVSGHAGHYDNGIEYTSVAKRLGDCTTNNKSLRLTVNGVVNTVLLNKNYTTMTNDDFLADVNAQLTNCAAHFYVYGREYFPMISDVAEYVHNFNPDAGASQAPIPKGSVVIRYKGTIKLANEGDTIFGVALDDIPVMRTTPEGVSKGQGRVMKRGYMSLNQTHAHYVRSDNQSAAVGSRFKTINGQLVSDVNGKVRVDIDNALVSINC